MALAYHGWQSASSISYSRRENTSSERATVSSDPKTNRQCRIQMNGGGGGGCWETLSFFSAVASPGNQRVTDINITFVDGTEAAEADGMSGPRSFRSACHLQLTLIEDDVKQARAELNVK